MPELPEVETVVRGLRRAVAGRVLQRPTIWQPAVIESDTRTFVRHTSHVEVRGLRRRGKWILMDLANGKTVMAHLRMTGRFRLAQTGAPRQRHDHLEWPLDAGPQTLRFNDQRRFGRFRLLATERVESHLSRRGWGPEPLDVSALEFAARLGLGSRSIKAALLDQGVVAGVGNIYADEILFAARIHPRTPVRRVGTTRRHRVYRAMQNILARAIEAGGTTLRDYLSMEEEPGGFRQELKVFHRDGEPCTVCGRLLAKTRIGGRSTHYCSRCQR